MAKSRIPAGMGGMNMNNLIKQAQKAQKEIENAQKELETKEYEFSAGGGAVIAKVNGKNELISIKISPEALDPDDADMLGDMVMIAVNGALGAAKEEAEKVMDRATGGMNINGLL